MFLRDPSLLGGAIKLWAVNKTRIIANNIARLRSNSPIFKTIANRASGPKPPHWEMLFSVSSLHFPVVRVFLWQVLIFR